MSIRNKILNRLLIFGAVIALFMAPFGLASFAYSYSQDDYFQDNYLQNDYSDFNYPQVNYPGQEYFSPVDTTPLTDCSVPTPDALADESYFYNGRSKDQCIAEYETEVQKILSKVNPAWSELRKIIFLHDYICDTTDYTTSANCTDFSDLIKQTAYGCIVRHNCVCDGFTRAFYDIANRMGIETYYIISSDYSHCWNLSKVNGKFYYIDVTWDGTYATTHSHFLKSESAFGHAYDDYLLSPLVNFGHENNGYVSVKGKYDNKEFDNALWKDVSGSLIMYENSDTFYYTGRDENDNPVIGLADAFSIKKIFNVSYEDSESRWGNYSGLAGKGNTIFTLRNGDIIDCGIVEGDNITFKMLKKSEWFTNYTKYFTGIYLKGNTLFYTELDKSSEKKTDYGIDVSEYLSSGSGSNGNNSSDDPESPMYLEGYNLLWYEAGGKYYWYENGEKQGTFNDPRGVIGDGTVRGREIFDPATNGWYWLDSIYSGAKAVNKEVWLPYIFQNEDSFSDTEMLDVSYNSDGGIGGLGQCVLEAIKNKSGKWVRYDKNGKMFKGWLTIEGDLAALYPAQAGNTYYYDSITGLMAKGDVFIDGVPHHFDEITGVCEY